MNTRDELLDEEAKRIGLIISVCMVCGKRLGTKDPKGTVPCVSHGLCVPCRDEYYPKPKKGE